MALSLRAVSRGSISTELDRVALRFRALQTTARITNNLKNTGDLFDQLWIYPLLFRPIRHKIFELPCVTLLAIISSLKLLVKYRSCDNVFCDFYNAIFCLINYVLSTHFVWRVNFCNGVTAQLTCMCNFVCLKQMNSFSDKQKHMSPLNSYISASTIRIKGTIISYTQERKLSKTKAERGQNKANLEYASENYNVSF